jgi:hypothetical protein
VRNSFGLSEEYSRNIYEVFFFLKYYGGWSFTEAYNLPVGLRNWFMERLKQQLKDEQDSMKNATKGR